MVTSIDWIVSKYGMKILLFKQRNSDVDIWIGNKTSPPTSNQIEELRDQISSMLRADVKIHTDDPPKHSKRIIREWVYDDKEDKAMALPNRDALRIKKAFKEQTK